MIMVITAEGTWVLENPANSLIAMHDAFIWMEERRLPGCPWCIFFGHAMLYSPCCVCCTLHFYMICNRCMLIIFIIYTLYIYV